MTLVDYVPCWRTPAGTGEGMGFMYWNSVGRIRLAVDRPPIHHALLWNA
jgi:hypothetical protein